MARFRITIIGLALLLAAPAPGQDTADTRPGGAATVARLADDTVFSQPSADLTPQELLKFKVGNQLFRRNWVAAPSAKPATDGLGPLYNATSCEACHRRDGRGHPPEADETPGPSLVLRISVPYGPDPRMRGIQDYLATRPDAVYGSQLQTLALPGHVAEARVSVRYDNVAVTLSGGQIISLRRPVYSVAGLGYGPMEPRARLGPRVAPQMIGLGLLEAIPDSDILDLADPGDADGDGISGRANMVWSLEQGRPMLGRFGHKAGAPTIVQQTAEAFSDDIGLSSPLFADPAGDCTPPQGACVGAPHGDKDARAVEIGAKGLDIVAFYSRHLGVPARAPAETPGVQRGAAIFHDAGCAACHRPAFALARPARDPETIWPYTDLLLHDMGDGLADGRAEGRATGREWRTPPLWGIGLTRQVSGRETYLHDGRARSLIEAILWHGGEAAQALDRVVAMPPADRAALILFLETL